MRWSWRDTITASEPTAGGRDAAIFANSAGNAYRQIGQSDAAITWYKRALETDPQFAFPYNGIGDAQRDRGLAERLADDRGGRFAVALRALGERLAEFGVEPDRLDAGGG